MNQKACCNKHCITETVKDTFWFVKQIPNQDGLTEKFKANNQMEWVCRVQNIEARAREIVATEPIYI